MYSYMYLEIYFYRKRCNCLEGLQLNDIRRKEAPDSLFSNSVEIFFVVLYLLRFQTKCDMMIWRLWLKYLRKQGNHMLQSLISFV